MKNPSIKGTIARVHEVTKKLQCPTITMMLKKLGLRMPILDCTPTGLCVDVFNKPQAPSDNRQLSKNKRHHTSVRAAQKTALTQQMEQLTFVDFYSACIRYTVDTGKADSPFSHCLSKHLKHEKPCYSRTMPSGPPYFLILATTSSFPIGTNEGLKLT